MRNKGPAPNVDPRMTLIILIARKLADFDGRRLEDCPKEARETYMRRAVLLEQLFQEHQSQELHDWRERHK